MPSRIIDSWTKRSGEEGKNFIFGARATAAGLYKALSVLAPRLHIEAFLVSDEGVKENPRTIWGCPVIQVGCIAVNLSEKEKRESRIFAAVPELIHREVKSVLLRCGFLNIIFLDSVTESAIMEMYFEKNGRYRSIHTLPFGQRDFAVPKLTVYAASHHKDKPLHHPPVFPAYVKSLCLGCDIALKEGVDVSDRAEYFDNAGDNISQKNPNRCEMTGYYWVWKNRLKTEDEYIGIYHYRRALDISTDDLRRMKANDVDVVLPYPMLHYPNAAIHHTWYVKESDWDVMREVMWDLYPKYARQMDSVFSSPEFYNYNMMLAKKRVFADYCAWLFPILDRIEELSDPKGCARHDRYTAYLSESLETLFFMVNLNKLKIYHTGRLLYT